MSTVAIRNNGFTSASPVTLKEKQSASNIVVAVLAAMLCFVLIVSVGMAVNTGMAFATANTATANTATANTNAEQATTTINTAIEGLSNQVYKVLKNAIMPVAGLGLAVAGFKLVFGGQRGMDSAWKIALICIAAIAVVFLAPLLIKAFGGWFVDSSSDMSSVNDLLG